MRTLALSLLTLSVLTGCKATDKKLQIENTNLKATVESQRIKIQELNSDNSQLYRKVNQLNESLDALSKGKEATNYELTVLRTQVRQSIKDQITNLNEFMTASNLLDYVGGELVARSKTGEKPLTVVDIQHPIEFTGAIQGVGAYVNEPTEVRVQILRPLKNDSYINVWESPVLPLEETGLVRKNFDVSIAVKKGDIIAYQFPQAVGVGFDQRFDKNASGVLFTKDMIKEHKTVKTRSMSGSREHRSYAIGVYALLDREVL